MDSILLKNCLTIDLKTGNKELKDILIEEGIIRRISTTIETPSCQCKTIEIGERFVLPGLIDCHTHLGIIEEATGKIGVDNNETSDSVTPHLRGLDAINPQDIAFVDALRAGVTTVMTGPGSNNAVGGLNLVIKTQGSIIDQMIVRSPAGLKISLGENPLSTYGAHGKCPVTRMGITGLIRDLFMRAQDYLELKQAGQIKSRDIRLEAVIPVLTGHISLRAHAHRADDIVTAVRIAEEFKIKKLVIEHGTEAHLVADYLVERNIPVAFGPMLTPRIKMELKSRNYNSVLKLTEAGVKVSLISDHPYNSIDQLRTVAILAISEGLSHVDAIKCLTVHPAEVLDCNNRLGQLKEGSDADLAIFSENPFNSMSKVIMTIINGKIAYQKD
ncbi:amidohydrolase [Desulfosporosinus meridiei]|uniref:Amidohydrolase, imidazolonepropionase n=1 Tax=Desulfosporosinus meridiei (strain ATCC BAA-275 / DSM 13257 / KCTC 12902 / NCIMB 13706 / S10) TaxID=768704 RepID=J7IXX6_DESMD|nr:amidohydrolase [Desulfosporosinus meridiei]AFQ44989.1 amidohydrolase, imidazolonepropionase [Desulfosporosinus meridiei DSM 13257]